MANGLLDRWTKQNNLIGNAVRDYKALPSTTAVSTSWDKPAPSLRSLIADFKAKTKSVNKGSAVPQFTEYAVKPGDSMWAIANRNKIDPNELIAANPQLKNPSMIQIGQQINIPNKGYKPFTETTVSSKDLDDIINAINADGSDSAKIVNYHKVLPSEHNFSIVNKKANRLYTYSPSGEYLGAKEVLTGTNPNDTRNFNADYSPELYNEIIKVHPEYAKGQIDLSRGGIEEYNMAEGSLQSRTTPAGIFTVSNKQYGGKDVSYAANSLNFFNERGQEQGMAIHTPGNKSRYPLFDDGNEKNNRISQGCVNIRPDDFTTIYNQMPKGSKMYVLPEEKTGKMTVDNYNLRYVPTESATDFDLKHNYYSPLGDNTSGYKVDYSQVKPEFREYIQNIETNKEDIKKILGINNDVYTKLLRTVNGILVNESGSGGIRKTLKNLIPDNNLLWSDPDKFRSRGLGQIKYGYLPQDGTKPFGITPENLSDNEKNSLAMMVSLLDKYKTVQSKLKKNNRKEYDMNSLLMYAYNRPNMLNKMQDMGGNSYVGRGIANLTPMTIPVRVY